MLETVTTKGSLRSILWQKTGILPAESLHCGTQGRQDLLPGPYLCQECAPPRCGGPRAGAGQSTPSLRASWRIVRGPEHYRHSFLPGASRMWSRESKWQGQTSLLGAVPDRGQPQGGWTGRLSLCVISTQETVIFKAPRTCSLTVLFPTRPPRGVISPPFRAAENCVERLPLSCLRSHGELVTDRSSSRVL